MLLQRGARLAVRERNRHHLFRARDTKNMRKQKLLLSKATGLAACKGTAGFLGAT